MELVENYLSTITQYYGSSDRPYEFVGSPELLFTDIKPQQALEPNSRTYIYGPAGSGKTTFLDWSMQFAAEKKSIIPFFISLRNYTSSLKDLLDVSISRFLIEEEEFQNIISLIPKQNHIALLFDGLDEVLDGFRDEVKSEIFKAINSIPGCSVIITSRLTPDQLEWENWKLIAIKPLSNAQIRNYLYEIDRDDRLWEEISSSSRLMELASKPSYLFTIRNAYLQGENYREYLMREIPRYTAWRGHTVSSLTSNTPPKLIDKALTQIALDTIIQNKYEIPEANIRRIVGDLVFDETTVDALYDAILGTDAITKIADSFYAFSHGTMLEAYAARGLLDDIRYSPAQIGEIMPSVLKSKYGSGVSNYLIKTLGVDEIQMLFGSVKESERTLLLKYSSGIIADRLTESESFSTRIGKVIDVATEIAENENQLSSKRREILVFAVHGFNTRGDWKNRLGFVLTKASNGEKYIYSAWDYGTFRLALLSPFSRSSKVRDFQDFYNKIVSRFQKRPEICIVAHSFGTYITAHAIRRFPEVEFDRVLFIGSALPRKFSWGNTLKKVRILLNVLGGSDIALLIAPFIPGLGNAGRLGFRDKPAAIIEKSLEFSGHSDFFGDESMRNAWLPFLRDGDVNYF